MRKRSWPLWGVLKTLLLPALVVALLVWFSTAVDNLGEGSGEESRQQLEEALRRGCAACYAAEGAYPPDLDYLTDHYGIQIDEERYTVYYEVYAENLMPDITVLEDP